MKQRRFGLKARFISLILILLTTIFAVIAAVMLRTNTAALRTDLFERSKAFSALATKPIGLTYLAYKDSGTILISQQMGNFTALDKNISNISIVNLNGTVAFSLKPGAMTIDQTAASSFEPSHVKNSKGSIERIIYPFVDNDGQHAFAIVYEVSSAGIDAAVSNIVKTIVLYSSLGLLASAVLTYILINRLFLRPIKQVRDQAMVVAAGDYGAKLSLDRHDEIGDLAGSVSQMADSLKADIQKLKEVDQVKTEFMMIASHNLRTPISIINGYLEIVRGQDLPDSFRHSIDGISANSQRLSIFAEDILVISSIESGQNVFHKEPIQVDTMLERTISEFQTLAGEKHINFIADIQPTSVSLQASKTHLVGAIWNLLENALKFTDENGSINLKLFQRDPQHIAIQVSDTGIGIHEQELSKLFTKFHRATSTLNYDYEGTGIGLYITKLIVNAHDGDITVESILGQGSTFTIVLPVTAPAQAQESQAN
jgi:signal transduction histidine kinase